MLRVALLLVFLFHTVVNQMCEHVDCPTPSEATKDIFKLNLECFNTTHLRVNWTAPTDHHRALYLSCKINTNSDSCDTTIANLDDSIPSGSEIVPVPNDTFTCEILGCGLEPVLFGDEYASKIHINISCNDETIHLSPSPSLASSSSTSLSPFSSLPTFLQSSMFSDSTTNLAKVTTVYSSPHSKSTMTSITSTTLLHHSSTKCKTTLHVSVYISFPLSALSTASTITTSTSVPSLPTGSENNQTIMSLLLVIALVIAVSTSALVVCTFLCVIALILNKRKKEQKLPDINDVPQQRDFTSTLQEYNPPPKPFSQPLSVPNITIHVPPAVSRYSSTGDDSVFGSEIEVEVHHTVGMKKVRDSGFEEIDQHNLKNKENLYTSNTDNMDNQKTSLTKHNNKSITHIMADTSVDSYLQTNNSSSITSPANLCVSDDGYITNEGSSSITNKSNDCEIYNVYEEIEDVQYEEIEDIDTYISLNNDTL